MMDLSRRDLAKSAAGFALMTAAMGSVQAVARAVQAGLDPMALVDPELREKAQAVIAQFNKMPPVSLKTLPQLRALAPKFAKPPLGTVPFEKRMIAGPKGNPELVVFVINKKAGASRPAILHTHGGGFIAGSAQSSIAELQELASTLDCAIVSVEYRLAPEARYFQSIEDNYSGLRWLHANANELGVDPTRIAVMGESAGGGHAALLAITARDRGEVPVAFQALIYPMLDDRTGSTRATPPHIGKLFWTAENNRFGWHSFLGGEPGRASAPRGAVPAREANLSGLPRTYIGVGALDLFVEEDMTYAQRLVGAGVPVELYVVPGAFHGFDAMAPDAAVSRQFTATKLSALKRGLGL